MALDKYLYTNNEYSWPDTTLDESYIERAIMGLFMIDVVRLIQTKAALLKNFRMQPSEVDKMPYWEYEYFLEALNDQVKEENDRQQEEMSKYKLDEQMSKINKMSKPSYAQPQMPSFGSMRMPSMKF